eukprot:TRINITY_DN9898_c1_g3_i2.p1 TRINITY_DN9898_c1_g3~~TRINITY_DN9898_c1_g3_i2.p1  ORF type:complete len:318 (-),score=53.78 TRINITY_DN9898_c1_g3_i2:8-820(-)
MPDADEEHVMNSLAGAAFGAAGQRCMALSAAVFVGETKNWIPGLKSRAESMKVGCGLDDGVDVGPLITPEAKERVERIIQSAVDQGANLLGTFHCPFPIIPIPLPSPLIPPLHSQSMVVVSPSQDMKRVTLSDPPSSPVSPQTWIATKKRSLGPSWSVSKSIPWKMPSNSQTRTPTATELQSSQRTAPLLANTRTRSMLVRSASTFPSQFHCQCSLSLVPVDQSVVMSTFTESKVLTSTLNSRLSLLSGENKKLQLPFLRLPPCQPWASK